MTQEEIVLKIRSFNVRKQKLLDALVVPARMAALVLVDAGHPKTAEPLKEIMFQLDVLKQEVGEFFDSNAVEAVNALMSMIENKEGG